MNFHFILLAGGSGARMGGGLPKQFREIRGRPLLYSSLEQFIRWPGGSSIVIVSHPEYLKRSEEILKEARLLPQWGERSSCVVAGGATRHDSTLCGLRASGEFAADSDVILLHDAARPNLENDELERLAQVFRENGECRLASLAAPLTETVVRGAGLPGNLIECLNRDELFTIKTPQALRYSIVTELIRQSGERSDFTDLLTWGAAAGVHGLLVPSGSKNIKITRPEDWTELS